MNFFLKKEVSNQRYEICNSCDKLNSAKFCTECGCFMPLKTRLPGVDCPLGKWSPSDQIDPNDPIQQEHNNIQLQETVIIVP